MQSLKHNHLSDLNEVARVTATRLAGEVAADSRAGRPNPDRRHNLLRVALVAKAGPYLNDEDVLEMITYLSLL